MVDDVTTYICIWRIMDWSFSMIIYKELDDDSVRQVLTLIEYQLWLMYWYQLSQHSMHAHAHAGTDFFSSYWFWMMHSCQFFTTKFTEQLDVHTHDNWYNQFMQCEPGEQLASQLASYSLCCVNCLSVCSYSVYELQLDKPLFNTAIQCVTTVLVTHHQNKNLVCIISTS